MAIAVAPTHDRVEAEQSIELLDLKSIKPAPDNPRKELGDVDELAQSMQELGLLQPLVVTPRDGMFMVVCGHRRYAAAKRAGLTAVPAIVRELTEPQRIKAMLIENCQRTDLTALEEARAYNGLVELEMSQREIARDVGKSQPHISKRLALLELPGNVLKAVDSAGITIGDALELLKLKDHPERLGAAFSRRGQHHYGVAGTVGEQLKELETEEKRRKAEARLTKEGVRVVQFTAVSWTPAPPKGAIEIEKSGGWTSLKLDPKTHASEPCHAAAIHPRTSEIHYFCTDRKRHPKLRTSSEQSNDRTRRSNSKRAEHDKEMAAARKVRRVFESELLKKKLPKDELVDVIVSALLQRVEAESRKVACQLLELAPIETKRYGRVEKDYAKPLTALAAKSAADRLKVAFALAVATEERGLDSTWSSWGDREKAYAAYLERHGYELSPAEKRERAGKRPAR